MRKGSIRFLGCGNAHSKELENSCAVFTLGPCELTIDFGFTAFHAFKSCYKRRPSAIFITHAHMDHIGGLENLFFDAYFASMPPIKLYVPHKLVSLVHQKIASIDHTLAEGNANFWDAFQLIPVSETFWHDGIKFRVFENRHHQPGFSFGIAVPGKFLYSGDTKPIPEIINYHASQGEWIFHDLSLAKQPSHTYIDELDCYTDNVLSRCAFYHLGNNVDIIECERRGLRVVRPDEIFEL